MTTVQRGQCPLCFKIFVHHRDQQRHKCPTKPPSLEDLEKIQQYPTAPSISLVPSADISVWRVFTDGSGPQPGVTTHAGWGVAVWVNDIRSSKRSLELFGPVCIDKGDPRWVGAELHTNNVAELTAMMEALLWLNSEAPGQAFTPAIIYYDSTYVVNAITGEGAPESNVTLKLVLQARTMLHKVREKRSVDFSYVKGHSGNTGNDHADKLAGMGSRGDQTTQSFRWLAPLSAPLPVDTLMVDHCWRCKKVYSGPSYARQLAGHQARCKVEGTPPSHICCRFTCGRQFAWKFTGTPGKHEHHAREARNKHEKICRGTEALTRICPFCEMEFSTSYSDEYLLQHRSTCASRPEDAPSLKRSWPCPKCSANIPVAKKADHEQSCRGSAKANRTCIKCQTLLQSAAACNKHEQMRRGSELANRTCSRRRIFSTFWC